MLKILALAAVLVFHPIATPAGVPATGTGFALEGFTLPAGCVVLVAGCTPTKSAAPMFVPETEKFRPSALVSFVAQSDGECRAAEVESIGGKTAAIPALTGTAETTKGQRAFLEAVLYDAEERIAGGADGTQPYRFAVVCQADDGTVTWSTFYAIDQTSPKET